MRPQVGVNLRGRARIGIFERMVLTANRRTCRRIDRTFIYNDLPGGEACINIILTTYSYNYIAHTTLSVCILTTISLVSVKEKR